MSSRVSYKRETRKDFCGSEFLTREPILASLQGEKKDSVSYIDNTQIISKALEKGNEMDSRLSFHNNFQIILQNMLGIVIPYSGSFQIRESQPQRQVQNQANCVAIHRSKINAPFTTLFFSLHNSTLNHLCIFHGCVCVNLHNW